MSSQQREEQRKREVLSKRNDLKAARQKARDQVCTSPRYPGKPENYTYVLQEYCRPKGNSRSHNEQAKMKGMKGMKDDVSSVRPAIPTNQTEKEIKKIQEILSAYEFDRQELPEDPRFMLFILPDLFDLMVSVNFRKKFPDPDRRFMHLSRQLQKDVKNSLNNNTVSSLGKMEISKQIVMRMMLSHLSASSV